MRTLNLFLTTLWIISTNAFTLQRHAHRLPSPLCSTEDASPDEPAEPSNEADADHALPSEESSDILNSPAFLQRKVEVLEGDLKKLDETYAEVNGVYEANKEEWG